MNIFSWLFIILTVFPGGFALYAAYVLWQNVQRLPGGLFPIVFCVLNGVYSLSVAVLMAVALLRAPNTSADLTAIFTVLYASQQMACVSMELFFMGKLNDRWLRRLLKIESPNAEAPQAPEETPAD